MREEHQLDSMARLTQGVKNQEWPHTTDAQVWADEWMKTLSTNPNIASDRECMVGWFANAIMAGVDTTNFRNGNKL